MHNYGTDDPRTAAYGTIAVAAVVVSIAVNAAAEAVGAPPTWLVSAPAVATSFGLIVAWFDRRGWRVPLLRSLGVSHLPDVEGVYEGDLVSTFDSSISIPVRITIEQTWSRIAIRLERLDEATSTSRSLTASMLWVGHDRVQLAYTYASEVRPGVADHDMTDHDGTAKLTIDLGEGLATGRYYNYRGRQGTLDLRRL